MSRKKLISDRVANNVAQVIYEATIEAAGDRRSFITFYDFTVIVYQLVQQGLTPRAAATYFGPAAAVTQLRDHEPLAEPVIP